MDFNSIVSKLKARWPDVEAPKVDLGDPFVLVPAERVLEIARFLKDDPELQFNSLMSLAGVDTGREFWVVYPLHSLKHRHKLTVKAVLPRENSVIDSVVSVWRAADFFEREAYDLYGIVFRNHPDLRRLINPPDWVGWPGRKDYEYPVDYHGVATLREDQFFSEAVDAGVTKREEAEKELQAKLGLGEKK
ncbi:MAG TPA: NADH-quinone oxidoreductase subunit C [Planctomycetota bacterium]|jgi:NADH-quinone oxidoreductase subunit C